MKKLLIGLVLTCGLIASELTITSKDGFKLYGWLDKPAKSTKSNPIILFAHQFAADHTIWNELTKKFNAKGFTTLNVDLRGHGKSILQNKKENKVISDDKLSNKMEALVQSGNKIGFEKIPLDLIAWLEYISEDKTIDMDNLYLFGSSLGGSSIIPLLSEYEAKGLVSISAGSPRKLAQDIDMALATSMTKTLFIATKNDPLGAATRTVEYAEKSILGTSILIYGDGHGTVILPNIEHYIFSFMDKIQ